MPVRALAPFSIALAIVVGLFLLMHWMVRPHMDSDGGGIEVIEGVEMVEIERQETPEQQLAKLEAAPPPPPDAPPSLERPDLPALDIPMAAAPMSAGPISIPVNIGGAGLGLGSGAFGGFARGSVGGTGSGAGYGSAQGFSGRPLIPLSTARPQMPEWACKQKIKGWVEVVFVVMPNGRVRDVKIVDANPRGVYEAAAIESVGNWIYEQGKKAKEVKQRVDMDPADCAYNWQ